MDAPVQFFEYWYFHVPNYLLAALMYSLVARFILSFAFAADSRNYIFRAFVRLTDPVLAIVRPITPRAVPPPVMVLFSVGVAADARSPCWSDLPPPGWRRG